MLLRVLYSNREFNLLHKIVFERCLQKLLATAKSTLLCALQLSSRTSGQITNILVSLVPQAVEGAFSVGTLVGVPTCKTSKKHRGENP